MASDERPTADQALSALLAPLARLMVQHGVTLNDAVEILKAALVEAVRAEDPGASASHVSLRTGVHRKDIKRLTGHPVTPDRASAAARVMALWRADPAFQQDGAPRSLSRGGDAGFDALVRRAKIDAAPATVLSLLIDAGNIEERDELLHFVRDAVVPADSAEKLRAAVATLSPHMATTVGNLAGDEPQLDQALRYSHLTDEAVEALRAEGAQLAQDMLQKLNAKAHALQEAEEGAKLFVLGVYMNSKEQSS